MEHNVSEHGLVRASFQRIEFELYGEFIRFLQMNHIGPAVASENIHATIVTNGSLVGAFRRNDLAKALKWMRAKTRNKMVVPT